MLIDTHAHLCDERLIDNIEQVLADAKANNVQKIICASYNLQSSIEAVALCEKYENVWATVGFHPQNAEEWTEDSYEKLKQLAMHKKVVAVGEIGLEYTRGTEDRELQKFVFQKQIDLAFEIKKPFVVHTRDAAKDTVDLLYANKNNFVGGVIHCFSESVETMNQLAKLGFYFAFGGVLTFKNAVNVQNTFVNTPTDRILMETDCPYLTPMPFRGKTNEPKYVLNVFEFAAHLLKMDQVELEKILENNTKTIFNI